MTTHLNFELGDVVYDSLTGFQGCLIGITEYLNGCRRLGLQSLELNKDGEPRDLLWFDEPQCLIFAKGRFAELAHVGSERLARPTSRPGGPRPDPVRR